MTKQGAVLFVSRRGSLRSVLAEACLNHLGSRRFIAFSCGQPAHLADTFHPAALGALASASIPLPSRDRPRSWEAFVRSGTTRFDFVVSLDEATQALEPRWPGQPDSALWAFPDAAGLSDPEQAAHTAIQVLFSLRRRLELLINLPLQGADRAAVRSDVRDLGYMQ